MNEVQTTQIIQSQREFFRSGVTLPVRFRIDMLKKLKCTIQEHEQEIQAALRKDLGKSGFESYMCETGLALSELSYMISHTSRFAKEHRVTTPLAQFPSRSYEKPCPYGSTLIMSPWNYPFLLTIDPLISAISAGNTAIIKPSAYSPATSSLVADLIGQCFPSHYVAVVTGGREENAFLLDQQFDFVFFTGSQSVGKEVLRHLADRLTPAVLELGGKSPCIVDETANIPLAARRIVFGKFLNCGQTCVAPDYVLCHEKIKDALLRAIADEIHAQYGSVPLDNINYGTIISPKHFHRICHLMDPEKVVVGGRRKEATLQIEPTVMDDVSWSDAIMKEEIFGPVLPILTYSHFDDLYPLLENQAKPLALYLFSENRTRIRKAMSQFQFGGGCINDTIIHLATSHMGFGGIGESGMGAYHGKTGFYAFSHTKSIVDKKTWLDLPMRYQPYRPLYEKLLRVFLR